MYPPKPLWREGFDRSGEAILLTSSKTCSTHIFQKKKLNGNWIPFWNGDVMRKSQLRT